MEELSIIFKPIHIITFEEYQALDRLASIGRTWSLVKRSSPDYPIVITQTTLEYVFDPEGLTMFCIFTNNFLTSWKTNLTKNLKDNEEFHLVNTFYIRPYYPKFI